MRGRTTRLTLHLAGRQCASCAMASGTGLEARPGVAEARTSFPRATAEVPFDPTRVGVEAIVAAVRTAGHTARTAS